MKCGMLNQERDRAKITSKEADDTRAVGDHRHPPRQLITQSLLLNKHRIKHTQCCGVWLSLKMIKIQFKNSSIHMQIRMTPIVNGYCLDLVKFS